MSTALMVIPPTPTQWYFWQGEFHQYIRFMRRMYRCLRYYAELPESVVSFMIHNYETGDRWKTSIAMKEIKEE